jgi:hypothetical protein
MNMADTSGKTTSTGRAPQRRGKNGRFLAPRHSFRDKSGRFGKRIPGTQTAVRDLTSSFKGNSLAAAAAGAATTGWSSAVAFAATPVGALIIAVVAAAAALLVLYKVMKAGIVAANAQEVSNVRMASVLHATGSAAGFTARSMSEMSAEMQKATGLSDSVIQDMQSVLATFRNVKGNNFKEATGYIADMSFVLKTDLKSSALQVGKALNDPVAGISALGRAGITFSKEQKQTIKSMVAMNDVAGAQGVILKELKNEFGGAAKAMGGTTTGQVDKLKQAWGDMWEKFGEGLKMILPIETALKSLTWTITKLGNAMKIMGETWKNASMEDMFWWLGADSMKDFKLFIAAPRRDKRDKKEDEKDIFQQSSFVGEARAGSVGAARVRGQSVAGILNKVAEYTRRTAEALERKRTAGMSAPSPQPAASNDIARGDGPSAPPTSGVLGQGGGGFMLTGRSTSSTQKPIFDFY